MGDIIMDTHTTKTMQPLIRQAFNGAVDRRKEPRAEADYELYFREVSASNDSGEAFYKKHQDKN